MNKETDNQKNHETALRRLMIAQLVVNGNFTSNGRIRFVPSKGNIIAKADLSEYDTSGACVVNGNIVVDDITISGLVLVTGYVSCKQ